MAIEQVERDDGLPGWVLAFGPFIIIGILLLMAGGLYLTFDFDWLAAESTTDILLIMTGIGFIAGILPVMVGMLWFPYFRRLEAHWIHAVLAFSAGILTFIAIEMTDEAIGYTIESSDPLMTGGVALGAAALTLVSMELLSRWREGKVTESGDRGLTIAYLVAIGLGLHSIGEGLAIGASFVSGEMGLVVLFTIGFIIHNITEGPAVVAAVAREQLTPPLRHFAALGILAGGGVIIGGWLGTFAYTPFLAALFFAIAAGAIVQVTWEMFDLVRTDAEEVFDKRLIIAFVLGIFVLFFLEEIVVEGWMGL